MNLTPDELGLIFMLNDHLLRLKDDKESQQKYRNYLSKKIGSILEKKKSENFSRDIKYNN